MVMPFCKQFWCDFYSLVNTLTQEKFAKQIDFRNYVGEWYARQTNLLVRLILELEFAKLEFQPKKTWNSSFLSSSSMWFFFFFLIPHKTYVGIFGLELEFVKLEFQNQSN